MSLRERKKQQTRETISEAARRLFAERGFDAVTVAEVAREADVSEGTVFNYFPAKEDLFYAQMEDFEAALVEAVRDRRRGESVVKAFHRFVVDRSARLAADETADAIAAAARIVAGSPALQAREREIVDRYTRALAEVLAEETKAPAGDVVPVVVASALMGAHRALVERVRGSIVAGRRGREVVADLRSQAKRAFTRLERGLGDEGAAAPPR